MHLSTLLQCVDQFWPRNCCICQCSVTNATAGGILIELCRNCTEQLLTLNCHINYPVPLNFALCSICGTDQFVTKAVNLPCECDASVLPFRHVVAPFRYAYPVNGLIHLFKYRKSAHWGRVFGLFICATATAQSVEGPDVFMPVPMTMRKYARRGFNPAEDLARVCGRHFNIPVRPDWGRRLEDTPSLAGLPRLKRFTEIRGAFAVSDQVADLHIGIIDDVLTTGATSVEFARELLDSGASAVSLWVIARTAAA